MTGTTLLYIIVGFLPSIVWLFFYLREDAHPEPNRLVVLVFFLGMLTAPIAVGAEYLFVKALNLLNISTAVQVSDLIRVPTLIVLLGISAIEELLKYSVVKLRILHDKEFDEPVDAMIYMVIAALGFAAVENILFIAGPFQQSLAQGFTVILARFLGATFLHALASAMIGFYIALAILHKVKHHHGHLVQGLMLAVAFHTLYNWLILQNQPLLVGMLLLLVAFLIGKAFQNLRRKVFKPTNYYSNFQTWQKNPF
ncbi:PrsW family intramembrane metalloprotease [Candidatus Parcubacteria bacterium]|nr:MAG: PrsW family intramembrane metalloprotease [Candidatus Parcubacteria bacterium]